MKSDELNQLIQYRLDQAQEALDDAQFLLENNRSSQSIVNRAYYAMFYAVMALLQLIEKAPSKHTGVISLFDKEFVHTGIFEKELSKYFHKAFEIRQNSDYKVLEQITPEKAMEMVQKAKKFVSSITTYIRNK